MACSNICSLCDNLVISQAVNFSDDTVIIDLPAGTYADGHKYCIVVAQTIPTTATIASNVVFTIGGGTTQYPLVTRNCRQVTACGIRTRTRYSTCVETSATGATFRMLGTPCCSPNTRLASVSGDTVATASASIPVVTAQTYSNTNSGKKS